MSVYDYVDIFFCVKCGRMSEHPVDPPMCEYKFINGQYWCARCQWVKFHEDLDKTFKKKVEELIRKGVLKGVTN